MTPEGRVCCMMAAAKEAGYFMRQLCHMGSSCFAKVKPKHSHSSVALTVQQLDVELAKTYHLVQATGAAGAFRLPLFSGGMNSECTVDWNSCATNLLLLKIRLLR